VNEMRICANGEKVFVIQMSAAATKILAALDLDVTRKEGGSTNFEKLLDSVNWNYKLAGLQTLRLQTVENLRSKSLLLDNGQHVGANITNYKVVEENSSVHYRENFGLLCVWIFTVCCISSSSSFCHLILETRPVLSASRQQLVWPTRETLSGLLLQ